MSTYRSDHSLHTLLKGALAGFVATAPMSLSMVIGWMLLPKGEKYPLPPRLITGRITKQLGIKNRLSENELVALTVLSHFGYGALSGSIYAYFHQKLAMHPVIKGALAGLGVWVGSYLGWLPALGILRPATQHPWQRNLIMIAAHLVWGATLGELTQKLTSRD